MQFVTCKFCVDAFSLLYSNLLHAKLSVFIWCLFLLNCIGKLLAYAASLFVNSVCVCLMCVPKCCVPSVCLIVVINLLNRFAMFDVCACLWSAL